MIPAKRRTYTDNLLLLLFAVIFFIVAHSRYNYRLDAVIGSGDTKGYYMYLPEVFVFHTIHIPGDYQFEGKRVNEKGESYTKFTCGVAYFGVPFFLAAHVYAHLFHRDASGFSKPYVYAVIIGGIFWAFIGLLLLKKLLQQYFSRGVTWATLLCIMLGTNFYNYASFEMGMSHVYSFALFAAIILTVDGYYKTPTFQKAMLIGLLIGWIILIRPTNAALLIFLFLYRINTAAALKERVLFFKDKVRHMLIAVPFAILPFIPQFLYWKQMTGQWVKYSYTGENFKYWWRPRIIQVLFDTQNGLFLWSPILLFFLWALFMRRKDPRTNFWGVSITFIIITYTFASWWAFWFGGAFGHRCYVEYFTMLVFPLAVTAERVLAIRKIWPLAPIVLIAALFCYYNIFMSTLYMSPGMGVFCGDAWEWNWWGWWELVKRMV